MGLEGFELLGFGGDQGVEAAQAVGDALLLGDFGMGKAECDKHRGLDAFSRRSSAVEIDRLLHLWAKQRLEQEFRNAFFGATPERDDSLSQSQLSIAWEEWRLLAKE